MGRAGFGKQDQELVCGIFRCPLNSEIETVNRKFACTCVIINEGITSVLIIFKTIDWMSSRRKTEYLGKGRGLGTGPWAF